MGRSFLYASVMLRFKSNRRLPKRRDKVAPVRAARVASLNSWQQARANRQSRLPRRGAERLEPRAMLSTGGVTYQGGPLINNVAVETVFLGQAWANNSQLVQNANDLNQFFNYVTNSSYMDLLHEYSTPQAGQIGRSRKFALRGKRFGRPAG